MEKMKMTNKMVRPATLLTLALAGSALVFGLSACGQSEWREVQAPNTGDVATETVLGDIRPGDAEAGDTAYVAPERLRTRTTPEENPELTTTVLERNEPVRIVDPAPSGPDQVVRVEFNDDSAQAVETAPVAPVAAQTPAVVPAPAVKKVVPKKVITPKKTSEKVAVAKPKKPVKKQAYVPLKYLKKAPVAITSDQASADRYIMIQNIATEKLRVYEATTSPGAPHRLIFETDMIAGENDPAKTRRTSLGSYKIEKWIKFYQDTQGLFPSWHDPKLASVPPPGAGLEAWTQKYLMPNPGDKSKGLVRGAFGWYTAKIGPNADAQWTHGTLGWGADKDFFIQLSKSQLAQFYSDPRSFGCTRVENRAIAFLQDLLPVGTRVIKVYAKESLSDASLARYNSMAAPEVFEWILTKDEVRIEKPMSSSRPKQLLRLADDSSVVETGTYEIDAIPSAVTFKKTVTADTLTATIVRAEANLYDLPEKSFQGEFLVDEGRFVNYKHPRELRRGGYTDGLLPKAVLKK